MLRIVKRPKSSTNAVELDVRNGGKPLLLRFRYDRVPPARVAARSAKTGDPVEVFESSFGTFIVQPTETDEVITISYVPGVGAAELDVERSMAIEESERPERSSRGLGDLYTRVKRKVEPRLREGGDKAEAIARAQRMWLGLDLATTAFQSGRIEEDTERALKEALGGDTVINFTGHSAEAAKELYDRLMDRMESRRALTVPPKDWGTEPPLELGDALQSLEAREAAILTHRLLLAAIETSDEYRLIWSAEGWVVRRELWHAMLSFASGRLYMKLEDEADGQFNCSPNGIALTLFAEYARAAHVRSRGSLRKKGKLRNEPPFVGNEDTRDKWRALWPMFVAMIEAFIDSYKRRGGRRVVAEYKGAALRQGESPWSLEHCERAMRSYTCMSEEQLLAHWWRLLRTMDRDA